MIKEYLRKNFIKFYINIYKDNAPQLSSRTQVRRVGLGQALLSAVAAQWRPHMLAAILQVQVL
jgi:hypothetical protein